MDGYLFRGLNNFNWELYQLALQRRQQYLSTVECSRWLEGVVWVLFEKGVAHDVVRMNRYCTIHTPCLRHMKWHHPHFHSNPFLPHLSHAWNGLHSISSRFNKEEGNPQFSPISDNRRPVFPSDFRHSSLSIILQNGMYLSRYGVLLSMPRARILTFP